MSNSTLAKIGIKDGECKPGRSKESARIAEPPTDVSGVPGSSDTDEGGADFELERMSDAEDGVDGAGVKG